MIKAAFYTRVGTEDQVREGYSKKLIPPALGLVHVTVEVCKCKEQVLPGSES